MTYLLTPILGLILALASLIVAPIGMLFAVWFIKWDAEPSVGSWQDNPVIRGDLPQWLRWFQTPDERFPGGLYEPTVLEWYDSKGPTYCSYMWAGMRNQLMGLAAWLGKPATDYIPEGNGFYKNGDVWRLSIPLGPIRIVLGHQVYRTKDGFLAVPVFTVKR